jgi:hypothetical protein
MVESNGNLHVTGLLVAGDNPRGTGAVLGDSHTDLGGGLPDALGVVTEGHVVGAGDSLTVVLALLAQESLNSSGVGVGAAAHVKVLAILTLRVLEAAELSKVVGPLLGTGGKRVVPRERLVTNSLAGLVVEVESLLLISVEVGRSGAGAGVGAGLSGSRGLSGGLLLLGLLGLGGSDVGGLGSWVLLGLLDDDGGRLLLLDRGGGGLLGNVGGLGSVASSGHVVSDVLILGNDLVVLVGVLPAAVGSGHGASGHHGNEEA